MKNGLQTSELWYSVLRQTLLVLVAFGVLTPGQIEAFVGGLDNWIQATVYLGQTLVPLILIVRDGLGYLKSRTELKKAQLYNQ